MGFIEKFQQIQRVVINYSRELALRKGGDALSAAADE